MASVYFGLRLTCALRAPGGSGGGGMADALVSGASVRKDVEVQLLSAAPVA